MLYKVKLKNSDKLVTLDDYVYEYLRSNERFKMLNFLKNLRLHSSGCAVFQKTWRKADGGYKTETIYLHKMIAEKYIELPDPNKQWYVSAKNNNKLDCRVENLEWRSKAQISRQRVTTNSIGYTGVRKERNRYRAVIFVNRKPVHIGMFATAEEAAIAYNKKSVELFGSAAKLNKIK